MKQKRRIVVAALLAIVAGVFYRYYGGSSAPAGQPPLVRIDAGNLGELRSAFNAARESARVVALFSPT